MYIGETLPIRITDTSDPALELKDDKIAIVVSNQGKVLFTFKKGSTDGQITIEQDDNGKNVIVAEGLTREQSIQLKPGRIEIECLIKVDDPDLPTGAFSIGTFIEPVLESKTKDITI